MVLRSLPDIAFSDAKKLLAVCKSSLGKKIQSLAQRYRTLSKVQNEIKKRCCCFIGHYCSF